MDGGGIKSKDNNLQACVQCIADGKISAELCVHPTGSACQKVASPIRTHLQDDPFNLIVPSCCNIAS